ncbi:hypothetical protein K0U73_12185 [bacterium]|nr:hypothetical protein [bacterium]
MARDYDCGRAAVRSAFVALTFEGLVEREANRGAKVRRISLREAIQITQARSALESLIAAEAARDASADDHADLNRSSTTCGALWPANEAVTTRCLMVCSTVASEK